MRKNVEALLSVLSHTHTACSSGSLLTVHVLCVCVCVTRSVCTKMCGLRLSQFVCVRFMSMDGGGGGGGGGALRVIQ